MSEAFLATRSASRLAELAAVRFPTYADAAEAFGLARTARLGCDVFASGGGRHALLATRRGLEREAARYDRYAGRLLLEGVELRYATAMAALIDFYATWPICFSPGGPLAKLGKAARRLRKVWNERHPDVAERRRAATRERRARAHASAPFSYRVPPRKGGLC